jgi:hypothetical protein
MLYFPQLTSGATVQYPFLKRLVHRTASSVSLDGRMYKLLDPGEARIEWELDFQTLTRDERAELETFFSVAEGRLGEFTLLDPTDNLLTWSEDLSASCWTKGPLLELTAGVLDPNGGSGATWIFNSGGAVQSVQQTISAPGWFHYCFSLQARSSDVARLTLFRTAGGVQEAAICPLSTNWTRLVHSGKSQGTDESVTFGFVLEGGTCVEVFGVQAEAQPAPSAYRRTTSRGGVCAQARFDDDVLSVIAEGPEQHSCKVRIVAPAAR